MGMVAGWFGSTAAIKLVSSTNASRPRVRACDVPWIGMGVVGNNHAVGLYNPSCAGISHALSHSIPWILIGMLIKPGGDAVGMLNVVAK